MYALETNKGVYHYGCFRHNINVEHLVTFDDREKATKCGEELRSYGEINQYKIFTLQERYQLMDFGEALCKLKVGRKVARKGWDGKGVFIELQVPDENSEMSSPYIFIDTIDAPKSRVPWLASHTDMLADDWVLK